MHATVFASEAKQSRATIFASEAKQSRTTVIASEAKQSRDLDFLDCFVTTFLAMTKSMRDYS